MNQVPLITIEKKTSNKIEQAKIILSIFCKLSNIHLSETELTVFAYFMVYKITKQTKDLILKSKVLSSPDSYANILTKLRKSKLIYKQNKKDLLIEKLSFELEPVVGIIIKIDNK